MAGLELETKIMESGVLGCLGNSYETSLYFSLNEFNVSSMASPVAFHYVSYNVPAETLS